MEIVILDAYLTVAVNRGWCLLSTLFQNKLYHEKTKHFYLKESYNLDFIT